MKVGDRVRCVNNSGNEEFYSIGSEGVVDHFDRDGDVWVVFDTGEYNRDCKGMWCGYPSRFEAIDA